MSVTKESLEHQLAEWIAYFETSESRADDVSEGLIQDLMALSIRLYAEKVTARTDHEAPILPAYKDSSGVTATQVAIVAAQLLDAADMDLFELQMWRMIGNY